MENRPATYLAIDLGAGSGRVIAGWLAADRLEIKEIHRFANRQVMLGDTLYWDFPALFDQIAHGIGKAVSEGHDVRGIGVDTWGVDFGLLDRAGTLLGNPVCYRDQRTAAMAEKVEKLIPSWEMFTRTGTGQMEINTIYQLMSLRLSGSPQLEIAGKLLLMPDLVNYFLCGRIVAEQTIASTTQMMNIRTGQWDTDITDAIGINRDILPEIVKPGTHLGPLTGNIARRTGAVDAQVYAVGSHDTASAVAAVSNRTRTGGTLFLCSGTWSLAGVDLAEPLLSKESFEGKFTNEAGVDGSNLFMSNLTGLWILQRMLAEWEEGGQQTDYKDLLDGCSRASGGIVIDTDHRIFNNPLSMCEAVAEFCRTSGQQPPSNRDEYVRCALESLALKYRDEFRRLSLVTGITPREVIVVGGGSRNHFLNHCIADCLNVRITTGPAEATAVGNIMQQAIASGEIPDWRHAAVISEASFPTESIEPEHDPRWDELYETYLRVCSNEGPLSYLR